MRTAMEVQNYLMLLIGYFSLNCIAALWFMRSRRATLTRAQIAPTLIVQGLLIWGALTCLK